MGGGAELLGLDVESDAEALLESDELGDGWVVRESTGEVEDLAQGRVAAHFRRDEIDLDGLTELVARVG